MAAVVRPLPTGYSHVHDERSGQPSPDVDSADSAWPPSLRRRYLAMCLLRLTDYEKPAPIRQVRRRINSEGGVGFLKQIAQFLGICTTEGGVQGIFRKSSNWNMIPGHHHPSQNNERSWPIAGQSDYGRNAPNALEAGIPSSFSSSPRCRVCNGHSADVDHRRIMEWNGLGYRICMISH
ncbi:hypothetical protein LY78DRAFT_74203 [Colletotrichum sublineola]|nr:hypothetical protein LY78DRAFT_74203 [Colletotrichum sublineola]